MTNRPQHFQLLRGGESVSPRRRSRRVGRTTTPAPAPPTQPVSSLSLAALHRFVADWIHASEGEQHTTRTLALKREVSQKLLWFLEHRQFQQCGISELRAFFAYLNNGHLEPGGRWGNPRMNKPMRPVSAQTYHAYLKGLFSWLVSEKVLDETPFSRIKGPRPQEDEILPFTHEQVEALFLAARRSRQPVRDEAILRFMYDTGVRASELCRLQLDHLNLAEGYARIYGKGQKYRVVTFGLRATRALWRHLEQEWGIRDRHSEITIDSVVFVSDNGKQAGEGLTRAGLLQLFERLGKRAGLIGERCHPHRMRHTFATHYLEAGGNLLDLKKLMGHTSLKMTDRYVSLTTSRMQTQRKFSPGDRLGKKDLGER